MNERQHVESNPANLEKAGAEKAAGTVHSDSSPHRTAEMSKTDKPKPPNELSAEEQMALYEKDLKENDWGHQPC